MRQSKQLSQLLKIQFFQMKNIVLRKLKDYPILSSLVLLLIIGYYFFYEIYFGTQFSQRALNPDVSKLLETILVPFFVHVLELSVMGVSIYVISSMLAKKTSKKLKMFPISNYSVISSSILLVMMIFIVLLLPIFFLVIFNLSTSIQVFFTFFILEGFLIGLVLLLLASVTLSLSLTISKLIKRLNGMKEVTNAVSAVLIVVLIRQIFKPMTLLDIYKFNYITVVISITVGLFLSHLYNKKMCNNLQYSEKHLRKFERIQIQSKQEIVKNHILLLLRNRSTYLELFLAYVALSVVLIVTNQHSINHDMTRNILIIFSVISSGIIFRFHLWFRLNSNNSLRKLLMYDAAFVFITSTVLYGLFLLFAYKSILVESLITYVFALVVVLVIQSVLRLKFNETGESSVSFIFFYSLVSFASLTSIEQLAKVLGF